MSDHMLPRRLGDAHLRLLRIFKAVVESGGFAAAEVVLNISRPAISQAMTELEETLNMKLCQRGRAGFAVTDQGEQAYQATLQLLGSLETFRTQINAINTELHGEFNIGITDNMVSVPQMHITRSLAALKNRGPDVIINIRMIPPNEIETATLDGRLQVGVVPQLRTLPGLNYLPLYEEQSLLYCAEGHPLFNDDRQAISATTLREYDAVMPAYPQPAGIKEQFQDLKASATSTDREGIAFLILSGQFIGFLPTHYAQQWVKQGRLRAIAPQQRHFTTPFGVITRKDARPNLILEAYLEEIQNLL
jgi:LysR family transcriptional regulator, transcriptional activator for bauABCD operon